MARFEMRRFGGMVDVRAMQGLARGCAREHMHVIDLPYRLSSWALDEPDNVGLWAEAGGELAAWAVMNSPFWTVDYACREELEGEVLRWADARARAAVGTRYGRPCWFANAYARQTGRLKALEQAGYADQGDVGEDSLSKVWMRRPGELPVGQYRIPAGFKVRALGGQVEVEAYVRLHQETFESKNMTVEWRRRTLEHPDYVPELDVVVEAPDGRLAAFCIGWLSQDDPRGPSGQVEPLGCHAEFRRYALGRVALAEVLRRLQGCGVQQMFVETDSYRSTALGLYESLGFEVVEEVRVWRKDYGND